MHKLQLQSILFVTVLLAAITFQSASALKRDSNENAEVAYKCFEESHAVRDPNSFKQISIGLQVTDRATHQIITRIFSIFLREILNYQNIAIIPLDYSVLPDYPYNEHRKYVHTLDLIRHHPDFPEMNMINLEVWMPTFRHYIPENITEAGPSITAGRFGWFVPITQVSKKNKFRSLQYDIFLNASDEYYNMYLMSETDLTMLRNYPDIEEYISPLCVTRNCVTLVAEHRNDSIFIKQQIVETKSYLNVIWVGRHFREIVGRLRKLYSSDDSTKRDKRFLVLHWTPSEVIHDNFEQITMPRCDEYDSLMIATCKYELTPLLKYYYKNLAWDHTLLHALREFHIFDNMLQQLFDNMQQQREFTGQGLNSVDIYNKVACNWLNDNQKIYRGWISIPEITKPTLLIGGIFPITVTTRGHQKITRAVMTAVAAVNRNSTVLSNFNLEVEKNDGQCKADMVMKAFIHYFNEPERVLGVLGPGCSDTVEPIAGISKHMNMAVMSYSAEGASFVDRHTYPYFFRTIGSNRQYEDVYIHLMRRLGWRRVAALTEDGQKYTEYISHMEASLKMHNLELIINKKFSSEATAAEMNKHLLDLKERSARIIIADIHNRNAAMAMCEAKKLGMTALEGYIWFLPSWLSKDWRVWHSITNKSCSAADLQVAFDGHFTIMHTPFGQPNSIMQEGQTVKSWLDSYKIENETLSNYIGFAYDAVWAYALAADKLLQEDKDALNNLRSKRVVDHLTKLIWETDFQGVSGRVRFGKGGSRITTLDILQWRRSKFIDVGRFKPTVVASGRDLQAEGGKLALNMIAIEWLNGKQPGDGSYDCTFSGLAETFATNCERAAFVFTTFVCFLVVITVSLVSFLFWKQRYDSKLKRSAKIMKTFGIDLLSPSRNSNTLDKWEIPKENVVINRRLGEGAFGTVYGGEAQIGSDDWTAVAVKTLKAGASTEDRLDFLSEAEAMKRFDHKNIVKLLAVCLQSEPIYTIMEFMLYGDLKTYLLARRNMVNEKTSDDSDISPKRLTMYAIDVAGGLAYLAKQKYVHRDLACRNCLVNAQRVVKLGDFGMARPTFESDYYRFNRKGMLPVRWMAPESLALGMFTPSSDIWAFGVVLYEIITFGSYPYQGQTNNQVLEYVKNGNTLPIPTGVKPPLEALLKSCWSQEAKKRPTANELIDYILNYPRLLTPCLDFPGAAVEMPETESDQLELLPKARKCSPLKRDTTLDILSQESSANDLEKYNSFISETSLIQNSASDMSSEIPIVLPQSSTDSFSPITPDGYSIMSPLLMNQICDSSDSSQAHLLKKPTVKT